MDDLQSDLPATFDTLIAVRRNHSSEEELLIGMIILLFQDLGIEKNFKQLKKKYILLPSSKLKQPSIESALHYLHENNINYPFSYESVCSILHINPKALRSKILECLEKEDNKATKIYRQWKEGSV